MILQLVEEVSWNEWKTSLKVENTSVFGQSVSFKRLNLYGIIYFWRIEPEQA